MNKTSYEDELERTGVVFSTTVGKSMEPMLVERETAVVIKKAKGLLKKYDVVLFRRKGGEYVLHRIIKVREKDYIICGDSCTEKEQVLHEQVIGVVTGYYKNGRLIPMSDRRYRLYVRFRCAVLPIRTGRALLRTALRKLRKKHH